ncbi:non-ribosomal peptide synthetase [Streptomyces purpurogeneiscleroticus]|uniref:non-ribosomal peptide synthetase n=1 Tax=Streptomyces purpurogeneiscleroticus TaxID=68259 RepID=UPI001CBC6207|nr:non-ribosomal peptide synthetase [Streptomyces purpurogeneiscleroticus]
MNTAPTPASGHGLADPGFPAALLAETDRDGRCRLLAEAVRTFLVTAATLEPDAGIDTPATLESLTAVELNAVLDARFGIELGLSMLRHPVSARDLAGTALGLMDEAPRTEQREGLVPDVVGRCEPFALTDLQQAYLLGRGGFFALGDVPAAFYAEIEADALDVPALEAAWDEVVSRHGMLRTVFTDDGLQRVLEEVPGYRFAVQDLRGLEEEERRGRLEGLRAEISGRVREPGEWPLFEIVVSRVEGERCVLHFAIDLLIADAPSIRRIVGEWLTLNSGGHLDPAPEVSFRDYVRALEGAEDSAVHAVAREYWLERLPELPAAPELPLRVAAESVTSAKFSSRSFGLRAEQWARLRQAALRHGLTPSMVLCWAYAATLRAWSATDEFTLNVTVNDRLPVHRDIDRVVGEFTSQVLVAVDADPGAPACDQVAALQDRFWEGFEHRAFSGVQVLRELARSGDGSRTTMPYVFDAVLGQDLDENTPDWFRGLAHVSATAPQVAIECQVFELGGELRVQWAVVEELFPDGLVDAAFGAFTGLVERLADDEEVWDAAVQGLVPPAELVARSEANATVAAVPEGLLHELGGYLAERGDAPAVIAAGRTLSFGECDRLASRIGRRLRELGACPNALVGVVMDKGWEQPVAALGVLYSGAAYLPVDAAWPVERVRRILERGGCRIVLTQSHLVEEVEWPAGVTVLAVDDSSVWSSVDDSPLEAAASPEDLAYVIFTSGSTGEPKGVMIDHRGAVNTVADINARFGVGTSDRVLGLSSLSFDLSVWDIFGMFAAGGALVVPEPEAHRDPAVWLELVREYEVTVWNSVPALMEMFTDHAAANGEAVEGLQLVLLSGDWIPLSLPGRIRDTAPDASVISLGGATEASIWSIHHPIGEVDPGWRSIPYGRPLANQYFAVLDGRLEPAPTWVPGELFSGGIGVARGYWGDAEKTAERFITHPVTGERLYRTGDLGRYLPDGNIEFLGRNDHQVKINGYRIELGEIEAQLNAHPAVKDAIVTAGHNQLTAYLTTAPHTTGSQQDDTRVTEWQNVFDAMRTEIGAVGDAFDTTGWTSTYTGRPIPNEAMRLWVEETVDRILECAPSHVLEIGCGTGLLATRLAPHARYTGIDVSAETLKTLQTYFDARPQQAENVRLRHAEARDLSGIEDSSVDCVVLNSVIQYFPSGDYLLEVLEEAARVLAPGGTLFVGDVRDLRLLHAFHTSVEMYRAAPADSVDDVAERIAQRALHERELAVAPDLFTELGGLGFSSVSLRPKTGDPCTEMADYRYDAILRKATAAERQEPDAGAVLEVAAEKPLDDLRAALREAADSGMATVVLHGVRNPRLASDLRAAEVLDAGTASTCEEVATVARTEGVRADDVRAIAADSGWRLEACLTEAPDTADLVFRRTAGTSDRLGRECTDNTDLRSGIAKLVNRPAAPQHTTELIASVRQHLAAVLPGYMLPRHYLVLEQFPLSANGKVDRGRLPSPELQSDEAVEGDDSAPRNLREEQLTAIWCEVLGRHGVGIHTDFFHAGGDSLLAARTAAVASGQGLPLTVGDILTHPTIAEQAQILADRAHTGSGEEEAALPVAVPDAAGRYEPFALTDLQQAYLLGRSGFFALGDVPAAFYAEIETDATDTSTLEAAWNAVVSRHGMLRTVFTDDGRQRVLEEVPAYRFAIHELRGPEEEERRERLAAVRAEISGRVREPGTWPLFEIAVSRVDGERCVLHVAIDLLIADGAALGRIVHEWSTFYRAPEAEMPLPEVSFRDYVRALEGLEDSAACTAARKYWLERLPELPAAPELPLRVAAESVTSAKFSSRSFGLRPEQWARLRQQALRHGLTPSMVLCWAYAATLQTWSASDAFTLNVTVNDRLPVHPDIDRVVGEFTSVILLAADTDPTATVREQTHALQNRFWEAFAHRAFSGVQVLRELARTDAGAPTTMPVVFTSALGAGETSLGQAATALGELTYTITQTPQVYLDCQVFELGGALRVQWAVVEELFPEGLVDSAFAAFTGLVERLADDEQVWDSASPGLVPASDLVARSEVNATAATLPQGLLHELGGYLAERGDAPAVITPDRTLRYADCDRMASRIGRRLRELGACPNALVGVVMDKGWEQPVAALGVLYSGAAYLPVDAGWPVERVRRILERGGCRIVLSQSHLVEEVEWPAGVTVLAVDDSSVWSSVDDSPLEAVASPEDLAYVIFTSGSTGEPKGVMIDHRGAANTITDINSRFGVTASDRVLALSSLSFDLSVWDIFGMFAVGGAVVLPGPDAHRDPAIWLETAREQGVSVWNSVPALMEMFTDYAAANGETVERLRLVLLSGDWIPLSLPGRIQDTAPNAHVLSLGGATEASIWSIHHPIQEVDPGWRSIPYGRPLANQSFAVLDGRLEAAPTWVPGELYIGGTGVARGYWGDAEKTAERFITHPMTGERLYRTGDLGRYLPDGNIEFLGRNDHQVKINGYRIELGEIEAHLNAHPAVKDAIVTAHHNQLTAYLTTAPHTTDGSETLTASLQEHLAARLPDYMLPRAFVTLDALPLTANGKIDRSALPAPQPLVSTAITDEREDSGDSPRNDIERRLKDIWTEVLPTDTVGIHDVFGELGGDSLLALRVISKAAEAGLALTPRQFFENPTIAGLARVATLAAPSTSAAPADVTGPAPLLPAQAMLLSGLSEEAARHHNYALFFELAEPMDKVALRVALRTVIARHDALRTGFTLQREGRQQEVHPAKELSTAPLEWLDLADLPAEEQDRTIEERAAQAQRSFDLTEPPLLRVLYFDRGGNRRPELLLIAHWLVVDNFSLRLVLDELLTAHDQIVEEGEAVLPPVSLPAAEWARRLAGHSSPPEGGPTAAARRAPESTAGEAETLIEVVGSATVDRLRAHAQGTATMGDVLLAALARAAQACGLGDAIDVEVDGHGRAAALPSDAAIDLSRTVGRLSVRYPLRVPAVADDQRGTEAVVAARSAQPNGGLDHALAAYGTTAHLHGGANGADFAFNYLGAVDELYSHPRLAPSAHRPGPLLHPETPLRHRFELLCGTVDGALLVGITSAGAERTEAARLLSGFVSELGATDGDEPPAGQPTDSRGTALAESFRHWLSPGTVG